MRERTHRDSKIERVQPLGFWRGYSRYIGLKGSVVDPLLSPPPTSYGVLVFPIPSLVAQSGLKLQGDEMFEFELPRCLVLEGARTHQRLLICSANN
jgi:hypothetical protein